MPTTKQELEIYHEDYVNSIKRNLHLIGEALKEPAPTKKALFNEQTVETLAEHGLAIKAITSLHSIPTTAITQDPIMLAAFERGRANIGSRVRAAIVDDALNNDMPYAKMHLDKVLNKEDAAQLLQVNLTQSPLENVSDAALLEFDVEDDPSN